MQLRATVLPVSQCKFHASQLLSDTKGQRSPRAAPCHRRSSASLQDYCTVNLQCTLSHRILTSTRLVVQRLAYFPQEAAKELSKYSLLVTVDARLPVAMFGYK